MAHHVLIIWALAKALDHTDYCTPTDTVEGQQAGWCWKPLQTKDWQLQPCWLGNNTHKYTPHTHRAQHNDTHTLKLLDAFPLSSPSPPPPLSCPVFHRCGYSCALSIFLSSFIPPPFRQRFPEQRGSFSLSRNTLDRRRYTCCCTPCKHTLCVTLLFPLSVSLLLSFSVLLPCTQCTHPLTYRPTLPHWSCSLI